MKLYSNKLVWKVILILLASLLIIASFIYLKRIINEVAAKDTNRVERWATSVQRKAELVELTNKTFEELREKEKQKMSLGEYQISYMEDTQGYHSLSNLTSKRAVSLHLYHKPISSCRIYNKELQSFKWVEMSDYSFEGKLLQEA